MPFLHKNRSALSASKASATSAPRFRRRERGYILLTLMLFVTLMVIAAAVVIPTVTFQAKRDREEELIHRATQYSRAIRRYVKKLGRYPTRVEDLESTNNIRYLRKRYKDPLTGKDFKLLHLGEVKMVGGVGLGVGQPGAPPAPGGLPNGIAGALQQAQGLAAGLNAGGLNAGGLNSGGTTSGTTSDKTSGSTGDPANPKQPGADKDDEDQDNTDDKPQAGFNGPTFGGGPIVGVASTSKSKTIRVFDKLDHYDKWQFIYDPGTDRGGLLSTPTQAPLQNATQNGQPGTSGTSGSSSGTSGGPPKPQQQPPPPEPPDGEPPN